MLRLSGRARERKENRKTTSLPDVAFDGDGPVMSFDNVLHEGQAQATAFYVMNESVAHALELLEDLCLFSGWNSDAVIGYLNGQVRSGSFRRDRKLLHVA